MRAWMVDLLRGLTTMPKASTSAPGNKEGAKSTSPLADVFRGKTAAQWRAEYASSYDWGPDIGREIVPDDD